MDAYNFGQQRNNVPALRCNSNLQYSENFEWDKKECRGSGSYGIVYRGKHRKTGRSVAVKVFKHSTGVHMEDFSILSSLRSQYIVEYVAEEKVIGKEDEKVLVMEYADENMFDLLEGYKNGFPKPVFLKFVDHLLCALLHLHEKKIAHRDIKPPNILIRKSHNVRLEEDPRLRFMLTDFGLFKQMEEQDQIIKSNKGTIWLWPSRMIYNKLGLCEAGYTKDEIDLWSSTYCIFWCATGRLPFQVSASEVAQSEKDLLKALGTILIKRCANGVAVYGDYDFGKKSVQEDPVYGQEMPEQDQSYSRAYRDILRIFFQKLLHINKEFLVMKRFAELCRELLSLNPVQYDFLNGSSDVEFYDASSTNNFTEATFERAVRNEWISLTEDKKEKRVVPDAFRKFVPTVGKIVREGEKFTPAGKEGKCIVGLLPGKELKNPPIAPNPDGLYLFALYKEGSDVVRVLENGNDTHITKFAQTQLPVVTLQEGSYPLASDLLSTHESGAKEMGQDSVQASGGTDIATVHISQQEDVTDAIKSDVRYFLGLDENSVDQAIQRHTTFMLAVAAGKKSDAERMMEKEEDVDAVIEWKDEQSGRYFRWIPLTLAVTGNKAEMVASLLKYKADANCCVECNVKHLFDGQLGANDNLHLRYSPLMRALAKIRTYIAELFFGRKDCMNPTSTNVVRLPAGEADANFILRFTPLMLAVASGNGVIVKQLCNKDTLTLPPLCEVAYLLEREADPNASCRLPYTALALAVAIGNLEMIHLLLKQAKQAGVSIVDADIECQVTGLSEKGLHKKLRYTPLMLAAAIGGKDVVELLLNEGANPNILIANDNRTAIGDAAYFGKTDIVKLLAVRGAHINLEKDGPTPLHCASQNGYATIVEYLVEKQANIHAKNKEGKTPLQVADQYHQEEIAVYLRRAEEANSLCASDR